MSAPGTPGQTSQLPASSRRIFVESEFATLRTVVLAQSQIRLPDPDTISSEQLEQELSISPQEVRDLLVRLLGRDHAQAMPERQRKWEAERSAFCDALEKHGVEVLRPRLLTPFEMAAGGAAGYSNSFVRDPWFTVGNAVIEGSLRFVHRRHEVLPSREIFKREVLPADCAWQALPQPELYPLDVEQGGPGPFLEGGDVLVFGKEVLVGISGRASTQLGAQWLQKALAPSGYRVHMIPLKPNFLHLDCAMSLVKEGLILVCEEALPQGIPSFLRDWQRITASESDAMQLGTNGLPISPDVYVADPMFRHIGDQIAAHGVHIEYVDFQISRAFGGAFRCSTQPLWRETL